MSTIDLTQPLATLLRESTHEAHETVENSPSAKLLLSGGLAQDEYIRYLMMLWHVYDTFERALDRHAAHPTLEPTYNPTLLARAPLLAADISYLLGVQESSWQTHPMYLSLFSSMPGPLQDYVSRIQEISDSSDPSPLLAHSYVRYLGDLSGGQTIRHVISKAYDLDETEGLGLSFYAFKELRTAKPASQGEMKRIKDWFRAGMNAAGETSAAVKVAVIAEANMAFNLNAGLFSTIKLKDKGSKDLLSKEIAVQVEHAQPEEKTYPIGQVIAVIAAVCLAHFLIVVGGFTGNKGYQKLLAIEAWLRNFFQSGTD
ncbi:hypothetical protein BDQ12DRAFT_679958 [Crucibulum laeve]|uniref:Heme oxygenase-like protein n=1 Tax=Crucibulum laeve TaxID=68775 RepID=A0A5C3M5S3_9AGAR|nr:hypothetical protein BDQ12DRAFT_679958 [Crucibulum laeve]